jgi:pimeloyl-ACP methyl ester carboxylesterase
MPVREAVLTQLRRYEDVGSGISEEFLQPVLGGGRTVAVLSRPLGESHDTGWVICHPYGMEQIHLGRLDVIVARALSAAGFPVLRFHGQGYGDSELGMRTVTLSSHVADATDAVRLLRSQPGVERVGVAGARLGGTVAALVADREDLPALSLWDPVVAGPSYANELLRRRAISDMVRKTDEEGAGHVAELRRQLESDGMIELGGFPFTRAAYQEIVAVDLTNDIKRFSGSSLLIAISRTGRVGARLASLSERLRALSGDSRVEIIQDRFAAEFGRFHYRTDPTTLGRRDTLFPISQGIAARTVRMAGEVGSDHGFPTATPPSGAQAARGIG